MSDDADMWPAAAEPRDRLVAKVPAVFTHGSIVYRNGKALFKAGPVPACPKCGARPVRGRTRITFHYAPSATREQEVDAWVCPCGEAYIPGDAARAAHAAAFASAQ